MARDNSINTNDIIMKKLRNRLLVPLLAGALLTVEGRAQKFVTNDYLQPNALSVRSGVDLTIICDRSSSMTGAKIAQLNAALKFFVNSVRNNATLKNNVKLAIYSFNDSWHQDRAMSALSSSDHIPTFTAAGTTNMTDVLSTINTRVSHSSHRESIVVLLTDGEPNNKTNAMKAGKSLNAQVFFAPVGVDGANMHFLEDISENAAKLRGLNLGAFFTDLRLSIEEYLNNQAIVLSAGAHKFQGISNTQNWRK